MQSFLTCSGGRVLSACMRRRVRSAGLPTKAPRPPAVRPATAFCHKGRGLPESIGVRGGVKGLQGVPKGSKASLEFQGFLPSFMSLRAAERLLKIPMRAVV